jgi:hypothetical protein
MTKRTFTAVTGYPVAVHDFGFRGWNRHERLILLVVVDCVLL